MEGGKQLHPNAPAHIHPILLSNSGGKGRINICYYTKPWIYFLPHPKPNQISPTVRRQGPQWNYLLLMDAKQQVFMLCPQGERKRHTNMPFLDPVLEEESDSFSSKDASSSGKKNSNHSEIHHSAHICKWKETVTEQGSAQVSKCQKTIGKLEVATESKKAPCRRKPAMQQFFTAAHKGKSQELTSQKRQGNLREGVISHK